MVRVGIVLFVAFGLLNAAHGYEFQAAKDYVSSLYKKASNFVQRTEPTTQIPITCEEDGLFPNPGDCGSFIKCTNGVHFIQPCVDDRHFNPETWRCEEPCVARCDSNLDCGCDSDDCQSEDVLSQLPLTEPIKEVNDETVTDSHPKEYLKQGDENICEKDDSVPYLLNCNLYLVCYKGNAIGTACPPGLHFSSQSRTCMEPCDAKCDPTLIDVCGWDSLKESPSRHPLYNIRCIKDGLYRHPENCGSFIQCANGNPYVMACPPALHFNEEKRRCEAQCDARCDTSIADQCGWEETSTSSHETTSEWSTAETETETSEEASIADHREGNLKAGQLLCPVDGLYPYFFCSSFVRCSNGEGTVIACPSGLDFSKRTRTCVDPCEARCDPTLAEECGWNSVKETSLSQSCIRDGFYRHPEKCDSFIHCVNGRAYVKACPLTLHFSETRKRCEIPCHAHCDASIAEECGWSSLKADEVCSRPRYKGPCRSYKIRHYYDSSDGQCKKFVYGGCRSNGNNFDTKEECLWTCGQTRFTKTAWISHRNSLGQPVFGFTCSKDGSYRNPTNCASYFRCSGGQLTVMFCYGNLHFSRETGRCELPCDARCDGLLAELCGWDSTVTDEFLDHPSSHSAGNSWKYSSERRPQEPTEEYLEYSTNLSFQEPTEVTLKHNDNVSPNKYTWKFSDDKSFQKPVEYSLKYPSEMSPPEYNENSWKYSYKEDSEVPTEISRQYSVNKSPQKTSRDFWKHISGRIPEEPSDDSWVTSTDNSFQEFTEDSTSYSPDMTVHEDTEDPRRYSTEYSKKYSPNNSWRSSTKSSFEYPTEVGTELSQVSDHLCIKDGLYPHPENCSAFIQCSNGNPFLMRCPESMHFSEETQRCETPCDAHCNASLACDCSWPECGEDSEVDCESRPEAGPCDIFVPRYYYDRDSGKCRHFLYGGCHGNKNNFLTLMECQDKCQKRLIGGFRCPSSSGNFGHYPDCVSYYECKRGIPTLKRCPRGTAFHHIKAKCVPEYQAVCVYECRDSDAVYPVETDCQSYIDCVNGIPKLEKCPLGHTFNPEKRDCVPGKTMSCAWY